MVGGTVAPMARPPRVKWPDAAREDIRPFQKFQELARRLVRVPKAEVEKEAEAFRAARGKRKKNLA